MHQNPKGFSGYRCFPPNREQQKYIKLFLFVPNILFWCQYMVAFFTPLAISLPQIFRLEYYMSFIRGILFVSQGKIYIYVIILWVVLSLINIYGQVVVSMLTILTRLVLNGGKAQPCSTKIYSTIFYCHWVSTKLYQTSISPTMGTIVSKYVISKKFGGNIDINSPFTIEPEEPDLTSIGGNIFLPIV